MDMTGFVAGIPEITVENVTVNLTCPEHVCEEQVCINYCPKERLPAIFVHAQMVAEANDYQKGLYDCTQYSKELFRRLDNDGYEPQFCYGKYKGYNHDWVKLGRMTVIEATTGTFIPPKEYERDYREKGCYGFVPEGY